MTACPGQVVSLRTGISYLLVVESERPGANAGTGAAGTGAGTGTGTGTGGAPGPNRVIVIEVEDAHFRFDSSVFMPEPVIEDPGVTPPLDVITGLDVLKTIFIRQKEFPDQTMLVAGHTDTSGPDAYNVRLSEKRAASVHALLTGDRDGWAQVSQGQNKPKDIQQVLSWANRVHGYDSDPGSIDGRIGGHTHTAIRKFKTAYNAEFSATAIPVNDAADSNFWKATYDVYMAELKKLLDTDDAGLADYRSTLRWADGSHHFVGCGESWPIDHVGANNYRSSTNRRVEVLFFDHDEFPSLACHPAPGRCRKDLCELYKQGSYQRDHLPVHPSAHPQSSPYFLAPETPGASNWIRIQHLYCYLATFNPDDTLKGVQLYKMNLGQLADPSSGVVDPIDCDRDAWLYFSHRDDLAEPSLRGARFRKTGGDLPLLGPVHLPCGPNVEVRVDPWQQRDWMIVNARDVGHGRFDVARMADWHGNYTLGVAATRIDGRPMFAIYGSEAEKDRQETWKGVDASGGGGPIDLVHWGNPGSTPMWIGTLSAPPTAKLKILLVKGGAVVCTYNEIAKGADNLVRDGFHVYDQALVARLEDGRLVSPGSGQNALIDALPNPPARFLLPGDMVWYDQGQTNNCGAFSFAAGMNYWLPYEFNPGGKDGAYCSREVPDTINGARTPADIETAADKFQMNGRDHDAEDLDRARSIKLVKLWLSAGVPVLFLSKEDSAAGWWERLWSYHWKILAGYEGNRFYMNNSGGNQEGEDLSTRDPGFDYEHAPIGNCVNSENNFWDKWKAAGGDIVDAFTSVDECTFIPLYPRNVNHRGPSIK